MSSSDLAYLLFPILILLFMVLVRMLDRKRCTLHVTATVTKVDSYLSRSHGRPGKRIWVYNPAFSYEHKGWTRTVQGRAFASWHNYAIGDQVELYINPKDGGDFIYKNLKQDPLMHIGLTMFSFSMLVFFMHIQ